VPINSHYWFPAKAPITWQGWVVLLVWIAMVIEGESLLSQHRQPFLLQLGYLFLMMLLFAVITCKKGDPARYTFCTRSNNRMERPRDL
jgi:hypothetical protein